MDTKKTNTLSVVLAVFNEENNIDECLRSVYSFASEIVIVDGGSTDKTIERALKYGARIIKTDNPPMFHINKQKALDAAKGYWILQLDADEVVSQELKEEITNDVLGKQSTVNGYFIPRKNFFWGKWMKKGGQYPDYVMRLVRNGKARFPCKSVHEQIEVEGETGFLKEPLLHYSYKTIQDYWKKADAYTSLTAQELLDRKTPLTITLWLDYMMWKPMTTFLSIFFRHKGFYHGWRGFIFSYWSSKRYPIAYLKYRKLLKFHQTRL